MVDGRSAAQALVRHVSAQRPARDRPLRLSPLGLLTRPALVRDGDTVREVGALGVTGRHARPSPSEHVLGGEWPDGSFDAYDAEVAAGFVRNLQVAIGSRSLREVARQAGIHHTTVMRILAGDVWPDLSSIARLELALGCPLWPGASNGTTRAGRAGKSAPPASRGRSGRGTRGRR